MSSYSTAAWANAPNPMTIVDQRTPCARAPQLFDPPRPGEHNPYLSRRQDVAIALCETCPILSSCRAWAFLRTVSGTDDGAILGGMTEEDRRDAIRQKNAPPIKIDQTPRPCRRGHSPAHITIRPNGDRRCRKCTAEQYRAARERRRKKEEGT